MKTRKQKQGGIIGAVMFLLGFFSLFALAALAAI